jgi:ribosome assembly protein 1
MDRAIVAGFDLAMSQGFLCEEPCQGVGMILEEWTLEDAEEESENSLEHCQDAQLHGQLISAAKQTFRAALKKQPLRLVTPMYHVKVSTSSTMLGKVHTVLSQRHAKVSFFIDFSYIYV